MRRNLIFGAVLAVVGVVASLLTTGSAEAVSCPSDATNPGASTLAECYIKTPDGVPSDPMATVRNIITVAIGLVGVVAVVVMIIGGISFITSQGDAPKVAKARNTILYGVVGLIIAVLSYTIVTFVLKDVLKSGP